MVKEETSLKQQPTTPVKSPGGDADPQVIFVTNGNAVASGPFNGDDNGVILCTVSKGDRAYCARLDATGKTTYANANANIDVIRASVVSGPNGLD